MTGTVTKSRHPGTGTGVAGVGDDGSVGCEEEAAQLAAAQPAAAADGRWRGGSGGGRTARRAGDDHERDAWMILFSAVDAMGRLRS